MIRNLHLKSNSEEKLRNDTPDISIGFTNKKRRVNVKQYTLL